MAAPKGDLLEGAVLDRALLKKGVVVGEERPYLLGQSRQI